METNWIGAQMDCLLKWAEKWPKKRQQMEEANSTEGKRGEGVNPPLFPVPWAGCANAEFAFGVEMERRGRAFRAVLDFEDGRRGDLQLDGEGPNRNRLGKSHWGWGGDKRICGRNGLFGKGKGKEYFGQRRRKTSQEIM
jgi:hypothetical protein